MEYNELRDIMLEKEDDKKGKGVKRILIIAAALTIVFLAVLIVMKILNTSDVADQVAQPDSRLTLPPEPDVAKQNPPQVVAQANPQANVSPNVQTQPPVAQPPKNDALFEQVPIIPENKGQESFEDMVKTLKEKEAKKQEQAIAAQNEATQATNQPPVIQPPKATDNTPRPEPKVAEPKKQEPKVAIVKPKPEPKTQQPPKTTPTKPKDSPSGNLAAGSYIQIFAVKNFNENTAEVQKLKSSGYSYKLYETNVKGSKVIKVLVGPYGSKELAGELAKIKKNVSSGAFIVNIQ